MRFCTWVPQRRFCGEAETQVSQWWFRATAVSSGCVGKLARLAQCRSLSSTYSQSQCHAGVEQFHRVKQMIRGIRDALSSTYPETQLACGLAKVDQENTTRRPTLPTLPEAPPSRRWQHAAELPGDRPFRVKKPTPPTLPKHTLPTLPEGRPSDLNCFVALVATEEQCSGGRDLCVLWWLATIGALETSMLRETDGGNGGTKRGNDVLLHCPLWCSRCQFHFVSSFVFVGCSDF